MHFVTTTLNIAKLVYYRIQWKNIQWVQYSWYQLYSSLVPVNLTLIECHKMPVAVLSYWLLFKCKVVAVSNAQCSMHHKKSPCVKSKTTILTGLRLGRRTNKTIVPCALINILWNKGRNKINDAWICIFCNFFSTLKAFNHTDSLSLRLKSCTTVNRHLLWLIYFFTWSFLSYPIAFILVLCKVQKCAQDYRYGISKFWVWSNN